MEYLGIGIIMIAAIAVVIIPYTKSKKRDAISSEGIGDINMVSDNQNGGLAEIHKLDELVIQMEMLPAEAIEDESMLVEITDSKVLTHVNNLVPGLAQAGNAANNAAQAINGEVLYRAIIPVGTKLADSKAMEGAARGIYHGTDRIKGHANLVPVEAKQGTAVVANPVAAVMSVTSMVVGQYYMAQINAELGAISDGISRIQDFQDNEYRGRVFSLVAHIKKIADFRAEILENDELRLSKITQLDILESECTQLLGQANLTLAGFAKKNKLDYKEYEKALGNAQNWFMYQRSLLDVLYEISDLYYTLQLGSVSREQCVALLSTYTNQVSETQTRLTAWHDETTKRLGIETDETRRKRAGFDGVVHFIPGLLNDDLNFRSIEKKTASMIVEQSSGDEVLHKANMSELYAEDVQLILKDRKIYYLPENYQKLQCDKTYVTEIKNRVEGNSSD